MAFIRPIVILLIFFGLLFTFRVPVQNTGYNISHSIIEPTKAFFQRLATATSSITGYSSLPGMNNGPYPQGLNSSATSSNSVRATSTSAVVVTSVDKLPPVKSDIASYNNSALTVQGIIDRTNAERTKKGITTLSHNVKLDKSAEAKLEDMFSNQYFEHVSPSGTSVSDLVNKAGYTYIVVGENLALGNFGGDANVILAWMNSPGHRANILDVRYQEIGVAVGRGVYEGKQQWLAVQHFGKPLTACPAIDAQLKSSIDSAQADLRTREQQINDLKKIIDSSSSDDPSYESNVQQYNNLAQEYNRRLDAFKTAVEHYNQSVQAFNTCAGLQN
ncbi:MAG: CAP domain-containing protein [Patescibacteria group bacterium]